MRDHNTVLQWPPRPYLGLNFYTDADARLFTGRDKEIEKCAAIFLGHSVRLLLLQGSSGAGKSSFLRAGLIPALQSDPHQAIVLIQDEEESVIRCTCDPLKWIALALSHTIKRQCPGAASQDPGTADAAMAAFCEHVHQMVAGTREQLLGELLAVIPIVTARICGTLTLVLDQVEEVLTTAPDAVEDGNTFSPSQAFFEFIYQVFINRLDFKIILAMRTEYYGRFFDECAINDDRRVAAFLLKPLRDPARLREIIVRPAQALDESSGNLVYGFQIEQQAVDRIIADLLDYLKYGAVTPLLQLVCARLYASLDGTRRTITMQDYLSFKGLEGVTLQYLDTAVRDALEATGNRLPARPWRKRDAFERSVQQWHLLLNSLVNRQGGGTLVSDIASLENLRRRAADIGIKTDIAPVLCAMCDGGNPVLRGQPKRQPTSFSLKHDFLAAVLRRWQFVYESVGSVKSKLLRFWRASFGAAAIIVVAAWFTLAIIRKHEVFTSRMTYAVSSPSSDFSQSLFLLVDNLQNSKWQPWLQSKSAKAMRDVLHRAPWYGGEYRAAGLSPDGRKLALLNVDGTAVLEMDLDGIIAGRISRFKLDDAAAAGLNSRMMPSVGYLDRLGLAAFIGDSLYVKGAEGKPRIVPLSDSIKMQLERLRAWRSEFLNGALHIMAASPDQGPQLINYELVLRPGPDTSVLDGQLTKYASVPDFSPMPMHADDSQALAYYTKSKDSTQFDLALNLGQGVRYIDLPSVTKLSSAANKDFTFAFIANDPNRIALKWDHSGVAVYQLGTGKAIEQRYVLGPGWNEAAARDYKDLLAPYISWAYSSLSAAAVDDGSTRFAWAGKSGIWVAAAAAHSLELQPLPNISGPFLSGEAGGTKLQFSKSGKHLLLLQQPLYNRPLKVRVYNLGREWYEWVESRDMDALSKLACATAHYNDRGLAMAQAISKLANGGFSQSVPCTPN